MNNKNNEINIIKLAENLKLAIKKAKISQKSLAQETGIDESEISKLIHGKVQEPKLKTIYKLASELQVSIDWLCEGDGEPESSDMNEKKLHNIIDFFLTYISLNNDNVIQKEKQLKIFLSGSMQVFWEKLTYFKRNEGQFKEYPEIYEYQKKDLVNKFKRAIIDMLGTKNINIKEARYLKVPCGGEVLKAFIDLKKLKKTSLHDEQYQMRYKKLLEKFSNATIETLLQNLSEIS